MTESRELARDRELEGESGTASTAIETFGGLVHVRWDDTATVTPFGQLVYFIDFLKTAGLWGIVR